MINVTRSSTVPESLNSQEIKDYLRALGEYHDDPTNCEEPKKTESYRNSDLLEAFDRDFYSKCYLTEQKFSNSWAMDVEHFIPQAERPDLAYEWTNLFPAEHRSNNMKPRKTPDGGYLNPCDEKDDVEKEILYSLGEFPYKPCFGARNKDNLKAVNTADLLNRIHNGHDANTAKATEELRIAISAKQDKIMKLLVEWLAPTTDEQTKFDAECELKKLLSRKSSFTMLCRSLPSVRMCFEKDFFD